MIALTVNFDQGCVEISADLGEVGPQAVDSVLVEHLLAVFGDEDQVNVHRGYAMTNAISAGPFLQVGVSGTGLAPGRGRDLGSVEAPPFLFAKQEKSLPQERREGRMSTAMANVLTYIHGNV